MRRFRILPVAAALVLTAGCTGPPDTSDDEPAPAPTPSVEDAEEPESDEAEPTEWDVAPRERAPLVRGDEGPAPAQDGDAEAAAKVARATVEAFLATDAADTWWSTFSQHLTPAAQEIWKYTDPRRVPDGTVQGTATAGPVSATDAEMTVPSTLGEFRVVLVRDSTEDPWLASAIEPPEETQ